MSTAGKLSILIAKRRANETSVIRTIPKLYEHLMTLNKAEMKFIILFLLNYKDIEYEAVDIRTGNHLKFQIAKLAASIVAYCKTSPSENVLISFCNSILKLNKVAL